MQADVNGTTIYFEEHGSGVPLVLIHGIGGSAEDWASVIPRLAGACRVIAVDVRGFGRSGKPPGPYSAQLWAGDISALLRYLDCGEAVIYGHSMGGVIAQRLVLDYPLQVKAAILQSTSSQVNEKAAAYWEQQADMIASEGLRPTIERRLASYSEDFIAANPQVIAADERRLRLNDPQAYAAGARAVARYNFTEELKLVDKPVLIIQGLDDTQTPPGGSVIMSRAIPGARLEMIEHCGHSVMTDQPNRMVELVLGFVREVEAANAP